MIIVRIVLNVFPTKRLEFTQTLLSMIEPTGKETGCLSYALFCDIEDENRFNILGEWETREDLDNHFGSHRFSVLLGSKALLRKPLDIAFYTISAVEGMDAVNSVR
ncbi:MAG: antibiotic biosynthesis monooxygenase [Deltaproteobacteria bacterium]|nr:antibiotic biosynthesis monooxygenase [Deltaproteobacteria bacterium]MBT4639425.1 antibiotic biosynthesis monooxygenase [Deltaproteobacteria bacterium]MBT6504808.1 antibiotic biosynthesis monooxygenase [Deltaproteobacteria bacterium]MBT6611668.1 antibiotic biosynthesis monooxygenase [Deltaproteobacteria bacterium]